jgi:hypothetical protein
MTLTYLASPYTSDDHAVMEGRHIQICQIASHLMLEGWYIFSPIAHCHPIAVHGGLPRDFRFWQDYDHLMMDACGNMIVAKLPGWEMSKGVDAETSYMYGHGKQVLYYNPLNKSLSETCTQ